MKALFDRLGRLWTALGLRGRLVAGYTALFAVLLVGIAIGETTVVRQMLIDDRKAALPTAASDLAAILKRPPGTNAIGFGMGINLPVVSSDSSLVVALFAPDGTILSRQIGAAAGNVDPKRLLDMRQAAAAIDGNPATPVTYQRQVGATAYLVQVHTMTSLTVQLRAPNGGAGTGNPPPPGNPVITGPEPAVVRTPVIVLAGESLRPVDDTVNALLFTTLAASALGLLLASIIGLDVTRRALRPLARMTATAQAIAAGGDGALEQRLRLPRYGDEVGRLATTFDHMLDRIQATIAERTRSETRLRHFAADASHELRTPLAAVSGYAEVLLMGGKDDPQTAEHVLRRMTGELERMNRLVSDLLMLARLDAGLPAHAQAIPVAPLLDGLVEETRLLAARAGRDLVIAADGEHGERDDLSVRADPDRLHQILLNLLHNAVKFTPDGGHITLCAGRENGAVALCVTDTGPGIAAAELPLLFDRFYRGDKARAREDDAAAGGAGLGLAIAQGLAQAQGGYIEVTSTPGAGSTFRVILPAAHVERP